VILCPLYLQVKGKRKFLAAFSTLSRGESNTNQPELARRDGRSHIRKGLDQNARGRGSERAYETNLVFAKRAISLVLPDLSRGIEDKPARIKVREYFRSFASWPNERQ